MRSDPKLSVTSVNQCYQRSKVSSLGHTRRTISLQFSTRDPTNIVLVATGERLTLGSPSTRSSIKGEKYDDCYIQKFIVINGHAENDIASFIALELTLLSPLQSAPKSEECSITHLHKAPVMPASMRLCHRTQESLDSAAARTVFLRPI